MPYALRRCPGGFLYFQGKTSLELARVVVGIANIEKYAAIAYVLSGQLPLFHICGMQTIRDWLNGKKNYDTGVALFMAHSDDEALKKAFEQGYSQYRQERLVKELMLILKNCQHEKVEYVTESKTIEVKSISVPSKTILPELRVPQQNDPYRDNWLPLYQEMNLLRHKLDEDMSDEKRGEMVHLILDLEQQCMLWWARRDEFLRTGKKEFFEPEKIQTSVTNTNQLRQVLLNLRSNISKKRKKLLSNPNDVKLLQEITALEEQKKQIEEKL